MTKLEYKVFPGNQCVFWKLIIEHIKKYDVQPNCLKCDGFGKDAEKYNWKCYSPYSNWRGGKWRPKKIKW